MDIREVHIKKILNATAIDLGDYVINPYKGCALSCLYCYVRCNKVIRNDTRQWGDYVDARINAPQMLRKELGTKRPARVLLGSTTECFQPLEARYRITGKIIDCLNDHKIYFNILTRSPLVLDYTAALKKGYCEAVYFTVNSYQEQLKRLLEPRSASFGERIDTVTRLAAEGIPVVPYVSPVLPSITDLGDIFSRLNRLRRIEFESLNFNLGNRDAVIRAIGSVYPRLGTYYRQMASDPEVYDDTWRRIRKEIMKWAIKTKKNHSFYVHKRHAYFENTYVRR